MRESRDIISIIATGIHGLKERVGLPQLWKGLCRKVGLSSLLWLVRILWLRKNVDFSRLERGPVRKSRTFRF